MNLIDYLKQEATPWVSLSIMAGGLVSAVILFWLVKVEAEFHIITTSF
jgi:hypothetical protein